MKIAETGKPLTATEVRQMKKAASNESRPTPSEAKQEAKKTGVPVIGRLTMTGRR